MSGIAHGPSVFDMAVLLGQEEVVMRMEKAYGIFDEVKAASLNT